MALAPAGSSDTSHKEFPHFNPFNWVTFLSPPPNYIGNGITADCDIEIPGKYFCQRQEKYFCQKQDNIFIERALCHFSGTWMEYFGDNSQATVGRQGRWDLRSKFAAFFDRICLLLFCKIFLLNVYFQVVILYVFQKFLPLVEKCFWCKWEGGWYNSAATIGRRRPWLDKLNLLWD